MLDRRQAFHDTALDAMLRAARHAFSPDERRRAFRTTVWSNLEPLNAGRTGRPYRGSHFPGDHGAGGGGVWLTGLSALTLDRVTEDARGAGLTFDDLALAAIRAEGDPLPLPGNSRTTDAGPIAAILRRFGGPATRLPGSPT